MLSLDAFSRAQSVTKALGGRAAPGPTGEASALPQRVRVQFGRGPILLREGKGGEGKREEMGGEKGEEDE